MEGGGGVNTRVKYTVFEEATVLSPATPFSTWEGRERNRGREREKEATSS